ncbi:MAG: twin-arginine translocation signal domain-containing protein [Candidatus Hydrogenedentes bacterium]|nr:twin-arginine translocation signal domain-containing protein [Candidatus Hydrogenedentota bacterium]
MNRRDFIKGTCALGTVAHFKENSPTGSVFG